MKAAVFYSTDRAGVRSKRSSVRDPGPGEVRVAIKAAGLCHSDLSVIDGTIPYPTPVVLGHEGAGIVDAVGVGVRAVKEGDAVIISTLSHCGRCSKCDDGHPTECRNAPSPKDAKPFTVGGKPAFQFANASVFVEYTVVREQGAIPIDPRVPFDRAALIGCGIMTGFGAVVNRARVETGATHGRVRRRRHRPQLRAGRRAWPAPSKIIAVDVMPQKLEWAQRFGATHVIDSSQGRSGRRDQGSHRRRRRLHLRVRRQHRGHQAGARRARPRRRADDRRRAEGRHDATSSSSTRSTRTSRSSAAATAPPGRSAISPCSPTSI